MDITDYNGKTVRYKSNMTVEENAQFFIGRVRAEQVEDGLICINGVWHNIESIEILEVVTFPDGCG